MRGPRFARTQGFFEAFKTVANSQLLEWRTKEAEAVKQIEEKRRTLETQSIRLDMGYIQKLAKDEAVLKTNLTNLRTWRPHLGELRKKYSAIGRRRWEARNKVATIREAYGRRASSNLKSALTDLQVSLKFARNAYSPDVERQIIEAMGWRTIQVPRASLLISNLTVPVLLEAIDKKDLKAIMSVKTDEGATIFARSDGEQIVERLSAPAIRFALERAEVFDLPRLSVTKLVEPSDGNARPITKDFSKLSLGQQQSVLLTLILSSDSNLPLIIDQPEDNLDAEFIYQSLVPVLRMAKERRQVIIVTHNPNIAVLGDAEQIIVLKSTSDKGSIVSRESIDHAATREIACNVLEGAKEAFQRRGKIYGLIK